MECNKKILIIVIIIILIVVLVIINFKNKIIQILNKFSDNLKQQTVILNNNLYCKDSDYVNNGKCSITIDNDIDIPDFISGDFKSKMLFCIDMVSRIIYQYKPEKLSTPLSIHPDLTLLKELTVNSKEYPIFSYIANDINNNIYIAFRGTMDKDDMITDIDYKQINIRNKNDIKVHHGFYHKFSLFKKDILNEIKKYNNINNIIITGHSLGSAVATLCAYELSKNKDNYNIYTYLFASPRVGDTEFCNDYNKNVPNTYRIVNISDIIPTLPPPISPNLKNPDKPYFYKHVGYIRNVEHFDNHWKSILNNHLIYNYRDYAINYE